MLQISATVQYVLLVETPRAPFYLLRIIPTPHNLFPATAQRAINKGFRVKSVKDAPAFGHRDGI
jgi:hypothetical protein